MTKKIGISLTDELYARIQDEVEIGRAASVSGLISEAVGVYLQRRGLADLVEELKAEYGEPSPEEKAWADAVHARAKAIARGEDPETRGEDQ